MIGYNILISGQAALEYLLSEITTRIYLTLLISYGTLTAV